MNEQEKKIVSLLLNEMAFEGAMKHFGEMEPDIPKELFHELEEIGLPEEYDRKTGTYRYTKMEFDTGKGDFKNCYQHLRTIRNNIIHANKAYLPDPPERLSDLLNWSEKFIESVYHSDSDFAARALQIKEALKIESF